MFVLTLGVSPRVSCSHLDSWLEEFQSNPTLREVRDMVRDMNCATSQKVFIGKRSPHPHTAASEAFVLHVPAASAAHMIILYIMAGRSAAVPTSFAVEVYCSCPGPQHVESLHPAHCCAACDAGMGC